MFWRVYRAGLLLLIAVSIAVGLVTRCVGEESPWPRVQHLGPYLAAELGGEPLEEEAIRERLGRLHDLLHVSLTYYDAGGARVAAAGVDTPGEDPALGELRDMVDGPPRFDAGIGSTAFRIPQDGGGSSYVVASWETRSGLQRLIVGILVVLLVSALILLPLSRALTRPLERIARTARAFGEGELSARTGVDRRDEIGALASSFDTMAERLETLVRSEKELLANVSHELRTPLARIRVALELCADEVDADGVRGHLEGIEGDVVELDRLLEDVLTAARLDLAARETEAAGFVLRMDSVDLASLLTDAAERFGRLHPAATLDVESPAEPASIDGDRALLRRVVDNVLDNAAKYGDLEAGPVVLEVRREPNALVIEVRDQGPGVAAEDLPMLFEPFFRTDEGRRERKGTGLGLALCRRVVEAHGGRIEATLPAGGGLAVSVRLPLHEVRH